MSKINNDHGAGYAFGSDFSLSAFNAEQKHKKRGRDDEMKSCRQTWAIPFNTRCGTCDHILVKGLHGYINRYRARDFVTKKPVDYLKIPMWDVSFKCTKCSHNIVFRTDFETSHITGGYHVITNGKRMAGDFHELMSKAAAADEARKIEEAKTASVPEAERKGLENQRRKEEAAKLALFMEARKASASASGVLSLHEQLLQEVSTTTNNGGGGDNIVNTATTINNNNLLADLNDGAEEGKGLSRGGDDGVDLTNDTSNGYDTEAGMERLRAELGIVVGEDGAIVDDEDGDEEYEDMSSDDNDVDISNIKNTSDEVKPPPSASATSQQDDLVDFFLGAVAPTKKTTTPVVSSSSKVASSPVVAPPTAAAPVVSNDDFFAQFS